LTINVEELKGLQKQRDSNLQLVIVPNGFHIRRKRVGSGSP